MSAGIFHPALRGASTPGLPPTFRNSPLSARAVSAGSRKRTGPGNMAAMSPVR